MTYDEAIAWWYGCIDYERRAPQPVDLKLEEMRTLLQLLGDPHRRLRIVHVAGSKGKGSISAMLAAVLRQAGYRTGLFTSPHLNAVEERIQVNGQAISACELAALIAEVRAAVGNKLQPTFFEVDTALGFLHFLRRRVEIAVVEVGLGGRFDSTNVCRPALSVITSISYDHTKILGSRLEQITFEKAGIIKPGRPVVSGALAPEARPVIERVAQERHAPLVELNRDFHLEYKPGRIGEQPPRVTIRTRKQSWPEMELGLVGAHQAANAAVVVACVEQLREQGLTIPGQAVAAGLANVFWPARLEVLGRSPWVVLDCAHNTASIQALIDTLNESFPPCRRILIFASSNDKDIPGMLRLLAPQFDYFLLTQFSYNPRAVPASELAAELAAIAPASQRICVPPAQAWELARSIARPGDLIAIAGSVFLAGELRPLLLAETRNSLPAA
ncbi:MAG TPA: folylpolyglutamate synthase/dihydrofolate synthase family protein [Gemmataceae bacterium]|jgi:dihydrofolate synthase/folylpolyglutamate synthase|nr:folylpolyglutamate synthase/dihydrofolate synthase family protein [Gemmataceae bacterium]